MEKNLSTKIKASIGALIVISVVVIGSSLTYLWARNDVITEFEWRLPAYEKNAKHAIEEGLFVTHRISDCKKAMVALDRHDEAKKLLLEAAAAFPNEIWIHNDLAWLLSVSPEEEQRDGELALHHAKIAANLTGHGTATVLDTLAAAYAEVGDFENAIKYEERAISIERSPEVMTKFQKRLRLYEKDRKLRVNLKEKYIRAATADWFENRLGVGL